MTGIAATESFPVDIDLDHDVNQGAGHIHRIVLDPERREVTIWSGYGVGVPVGLWNGLVCCLGRVADGTADLDWLDALLRQDATQVDLEAVCDGFDIHFDGSNNVGRLDEEGAAALSRISSAIEEAAQFAPRFYAAAEWAGDVEVRDVIAHSSVAAWAKAECESALPEFYLDEAALVEAMKERVNEWVDELLDFSEGKLECGDFDWADDLLNDLWEERDGRFYGDGAQELRAIALGVAIHDARTQEQAQEGEDTGLRAEVNLNGSWSVEDARGILWRPDAAAQAEIAASNDPRSAAVAMCHSTPRRGTWHN